MKRTRNFSKDLYNDFKYIAEICNESMQYMKDGKVDYALHNVQHLQLWFYTLTDKTFRMKNI